jgi:hypothetical protein
MISPVPNYVAIQNKYNKAIDKYIQTIDTRILVSDEYEAKALNKLIPNIQHIGINELNNEMFMEAKDTSKIESYKKFPILNSLNKHSISHYIRKETEAMALVQHLKLKTFFFKCKDKTCTMRHMEDESHEYNERLRQQFTRLRQIKEEDNEEEEEEEEEEENDNQQQQQNYDELNDERMQREVEQQLGYQGDVYPEENQEDPHYLGRIDKTKQQPEKFDGLKTYNDMIKLTKMYNYNKNDDILIKVPTRPIVDMNSSRLVASNIVDTILIPDMDAADSDRIRQIIDAVDEKNRQVAIDQKALHNNFENFEDLKIRTAQQTFQQFTTNLETFVPRYNNRAEDTLFLGTDVLYYIPDEDIYQAADKLNSGTFFIGAIHIPKYYDTEEHLITYVGDDKTFTEGKMKLIPNEIDYEMKEYDNSNCKMFMEMAGNDHTYCHNIRFPELAFHKFTILNPGKDRDYIVKAIVQNQVDTGATLYTTITLVKIRNPKVQDILDMDLMTMGYKYYADKFQHIIDVIQDKDKYYGEQYRQGLITSRKNMLTEQRNKKQQALNELNKAICDNINKTKYNSISNSSNSHMINNNNRSISIINLNDSNNNIMNSEANLLNNSDFQLANNQGGLINNNNIAVNRENILINNNNNLQNLITRKERLEHDIDDIVKQINDPHVVIEEDEQEKDKYIKAQKKANKNYLYRNIYEEFLPKSSSITNADYGKYVITKNIVNGRVQINKQINPAYQKLIVEQQTAIIQQQGQRYYIVRKKNGGGIDTSIMLKSSINEILANYTMTPVKEDLINKLNTKIVLANVIDGQFIRALINFVNREQKDYTIDMTISLITKCLYKVLDSEAQISILQDAGLTDMINKMKSGQVVKVPNSIWEAFITGKLFKYFKIKIMNEWVFSDKTEGDLKKVSHFQ